MSVGGCGGEITKEHYVSRTFLDALGGPFTVVGLDPQEPDRAVTATASTLVVKALCSTHNSALEWVDRVGSEAALALRTFDHQLGPTGPRRRSATVTVHGEALERWVAKVGLGLLHRTTFGGTRIGSDRRAALLALVFRGIPLPEPWGLYVDARRGDRLHSPNDLEIRLLHHPGDDGLRGVSLRVGSFPWMLALGRPDQLLPENYRPGEITLWSADGRRSRTVRFRWPGTPGQHLALSTTRIG